MCRFSSEASAKISFLISLLQVNLKLFLKIFRPPFLRLFSISKRFPCEAVAKVRLCFLITSFTYIFLKVFSSHYFQRLSISFRLSVEASAKVYFRMDNPNSDLLFYFFFSGLNVVRSQQPSYLMTKARSYDYDQA